MSFKLVTMLITLPMFLASCGQNSSNENQVLSIKDHEQDILFCSFKLYNMDSVTGEISGNYLEKNTGFMISEKAKQLQEFTISAESSSSEGLSIRFITGKDGFSVHNFGDNTLNVEDAALISTAHKYSRDSKSVIDENLVAVDLRPGRIFLSTRVKINNIKIEVATYNNLDMLCYSQPPLDKSKSESLKN